MAYVLNRQEFDARMAELIEAAKNDHLDRWLSSDLVDFLCDQIYGDNWVEPFYADYCQWAKDKPQAFRSRDDFIKQAKVMAIKTVESHADGSYSYPTIRRRGA